MLGQYEIKGPISKDIMDQNTAQRPKKKEKRIKNKFGSIQVILKGRVRFQGQLVSYFIKNMQAAASSKRFTRNRRIRN